MILYTDKTIFLKGNKTNTIRGSFFGNFIEFLAITKADLVT